MLNVVVVCVTTAFVAGDTDAKDYCPSEHFNVTCPPNDVILMEHAQYGRMRSGRCVSGHHGVVGCAVDVLAFFDRKCSGKTRCSVYVADPALQKLEPCSKDFTSYLEAKYTCLSGNSQQLRLLRCLSTLAHGVDHRYSDRLVCLSVYLSLRMN